MPLPPRRGALLTLLEVTAVLLAGLLAHASVAPALVAAVVAALVAGAAGLRRPRLVLSLAAELPGLLVTAGVATLVLVAAGASVAAGPLALAGLLLGHAAVGAAIRLLREAGRLERRVVLVGTGPDARRLGAALLDRPELGLRPVGYVATGGRLDPSGARGLPAVLLGPVTGLARTMAEERVTVALVTSAEPAAVEGLLATGAEVYAVPSTDPASAQQPPERVAGVPLVRLRARPAPAPVRAVQRLVEVVSAVVALVPALPVAVLLGALVRLETGGVLVATEAGPRFRTRRAGPASAFSIPTGSGPVGRVLRRSGLDALPAAVAVLLLRVRYTGGVRPAPSATPALPDEPQVDVGQLAG